MMKRPLLTVALALASTLARPAPIDYWQFELLHSFDSGDMGEYPLAGLVEVNGSFWGTALAGKKDHGTVFKFTPDTGMQLMHAFKGSDGFSPEAGLLRVGDNLYGTTKLGGETDRGVAFKITTAGAFTTLSSLGTTSGYWPVAGLALGGDGGLYGTTTFGAASGIGSVFRVDGAGTLSVMHSFHALRGGGTDGEQAEAALLRHPKTGDFYGTTLVGGLYGQGAVFKMTPSGQVTLLHSFLGGSDPLGCKPQAGLALAADGSMAGVTSFCGSQGGGTLFKLSPDGTVSLLHTFSSAEQGEKPMAALVQRSDGRFYGTASKGAWGCGSVFSKSASARGSFKLLHVFAADGHDGCDPRGALITGSDGALYGTTTYGGANGRGTIFRLRHIVNPPAQ